MFRRPLLLSLLLIALTCVSARSQASTFTHANVAYSVEFPSSTWRLTQQPDEQRGQAEWVYGDRTQGYLVIKKEMIDPGVTAEKRAQDDKDITLRYLPGYVDGSQERFSGNLSGVVLTYEYTQSGHPMLGRIYYLQADLRTLYILKLTGYKRELGLIRNQTDQIARSFKLKQ